MKIKKISLLLLLLGAIFSLSACRAKTTASDAGVLFVNRLIYEEQDPRFEMSFADGIELAQTIKTKRETLLKDLVTSFNEFGSVISASQTEEFMNVWFGQMKELTAYDVSEIKENKKDKTTTVVYAIRGLDFTTVYRRTMDELVLRMLADDNLYKNNAKLGDLIIQLLTAEMKKGPVLPEPLTLTLTLTKEKQKWLVATAKSEEINNLLLAFLVGVENVEAYSKEIGDALTASMDEMRDKVQTELDQEGGTSSSSQTDKEPGTPSSSQDSQPSATSASQGTVTIETTETYAE